MKNRNPDTALNKDAFERLFKENYALLCNFGFGYVNDYDTAREIVQEVFMNLWMKRETITPQQNVKSYLFTSVKNRCLNYIRDHKKFRSYVLDVEIESEAPVGEMSGHTEEELELKLEMALQKLPEKCRQVFEMSRFEQMKYKEIAEKAGISIKTVEAQMSKALKILNQELKELLMLFLAFSTKIFY